MAIFWETLKTNQSGKKVLTQERFLSVRRSLINGLLGTLIRKNDVYTDYPTFCKLLLSNSAKAPETDQSLCFL